MRICAHTHTFYQYRFWKRRINTPWIQKQPVTAWICCTVLSSKKYRWYKRRNCRTDRRYLRRHRCRCKCLDCQIHRRRGAPPHFRRSSYCNGFLCRLRNSVYHSRSVHCPSAAGTDPHARGYHDIGNQLLKSILPGRTLSLCL